MDSICDIDSCFLLCWYILELPKRHKAAKKVFMACYYNDDSSCLVYGTQGT